MNTARQIPGGCRTRGPALSALAKRAPMEEALMAADASGLVIASNKRMSEALIGSGEWRGISDVLACWTGTMAGYDKPDRKLGKTIEYEDPATGFRYVFPVPYEHVGKRNVALVAEHPGFILVRDGKYRVVQATDVGAIERFPASDGGWFIGDPRHDIPKGDIVDCGHRGGRFLWRIEKRVGLVARDSHQGVEMISLIIYLNEEPSLAFGAAVEAVC